MEHFFRNTLRAVQHHRAVKDTHGSVPLSPASLPPLLQQHSEHVMHMMQRRDTSTNGAAVPTRVHPGVGLLPSVLPPDLSLPTSHHGDADHACAGGDSGGRVPPPRQPSSASPSQPAAGAAVDLLAGHLLLLRYQLNLALQCQSGPLYEVAMPGRGRWYTYTQQYSHASHV